MPGLELDHPYMQHVGDLEEWNEGTGFVWADPILFPSNDLCVVVHPHTYPNWDGSKVTKSVAIAVYTTAGERKALWVIDGKADGVKWDHNYWGGSR